MKKETVRDQRLDLISYIVFLVLVLLLTFLFVKYVAQRTRVVGSSMETTLQDGDNLFVDKITYRFNDPQRYDIIVFPFHGDESGSVHYIKRIIGLPGETVQIDSEGNIYINGIIIYENFGKDRIDNPGIASEPIALGEDEYFVLGDNRNNSSDSRTSTVGNIRKSEIVGKAFIRVFPFNKISLIKHG